MNDYKALCIDIGASVADAARTLEVNVQKICLVVDDGILRGTVTDGDIRRSLLKGIAFDAPVSKAMNPRPRTLSDTDNRDAIQSLMREHALLHLPITNAGGRLVGLVSQDDLTSEDQQHGNWVVLMAGGLGERLRPLTNDTPKPLLQIGDKPLLQSILESFIKQKFGKFYIAVNYHSEAIMQHFGDGSDWGVHIRYLEEQQRMGTAGALSLLPELPDEPIIVMNGDLVTRTRFGELLDFHASHRADATMCVREYDFQVPFGVISTNDHRISTIDEKPVHRFFVNAGIYVLNPSVIDGIARNTRTDMTQVFERIIAGGGETAAFPIHEYWLDIGRIDDLERAQSDSKIGRDA